MLVLYYSIPSEHKFSKFKKLIENGKIITIAEHDRDLYSILKTLRNQVLKTIRKYCDYNDVYKGWIIRNVDYLEDLIHELEEIFKKYEGLGFKPGQDFHFIIVNIIEFYKYP